MPQITINNFKGISLSEGQWADGFATWVKGIDLYGLNDNYNKISYPGQLQGALSATVMAEAVSPSAVTEAIQDFAYYPSQLRYYAIGRVNPGRIYRLQDTASVDTWTYVSAINVSGNGNNLKEYGGDLYYATHTYIGKYNGTDGYANWQQISDADDVLTSPRPMQIFSGHLFIGFGKHVGKYDGSTWTEKKLSLPEDFIIRDMQVFEDRLFISADDRAQARIFIWDGTSETFEDFIIVGDESRGISIVASNGLLWGVSNRGTTSPTKALMNQVYVFNGSVFDPILLLPVQRSNSFSPPAGLAPYRTGILIGSSNLGDVDYGGGSSGLFYVGKDVSRNQFYSTLLFTKDGSATGSIVNGIFTGGGNSPNSHSIPILWGNIASGEYEILTLGTYPDTAPVWWSLPIDAGDPGRGKTWNSIKINTDTGLSSTDSVTIKYKLDRDTTGFTTLKTLTSDSEIQKVIPIRRKSRTIEIRIEPNSSSSQGVRVVSFTLNYSPAQ